MDLNIFGDLAQVFVLCQITSAATDYRSMSFGKLEKPFSGMSEDIATSPGALSSGSNVSITVDAVPATWAVDREIFIWTTTDTTATAKIEKTTIKTLVGNTITCDLTNSYTANCRLSEHFGYICQSTTSFGYLQGLIGPNGLASQTFQGLTWNTGIMGSYVDPGGYEERYGMSPASVIGTSGFMGYLRGAYRVGTNLALKDVLADIAGAEYRHLKVYSNVYMVFLEV